MKNLNLSPLNKFKNHKVSISIYDFQEQYSIASTYVYGQLDFFIDNDELILIDQTEEESDTKVRISHVKIIKNLCDNLYHDVVDLVLDERIVSISCAEEEPKYPRCFKCGKEIKDNDTIWHIGGNASYGSHYDSAGNELNDILNALPICDNCVFEWIGKLE